MANRYYVGANASWTTSATAIWSATSGGAGGASVPTAGDSVFFDRAGSFTVSLVGSLNCLDITVSAGTVRFQGTNATLRIAGSMSFIAGTTYATTGTITFAGAGGSYTITTNGTQLVPATINFEGATSNYTLGSALTMGSTTICTLTNTTLNLNNFTLTTRTFSSSNTNARTINFGTGNIVTTGVDANQGLQMSVMNNFTRTASTGGFSVAVNSLSGIRQGDGGGASAANACNVTVNGIISTGILRSNSWFNHLIFINDSTSTTVPTGDFNVSSITLNSGSNVLRYSGYIITAVGTGTFTTNGKTLRSLTINHSGTTTLAGALTTLATNATTSIVTLTSGTLDLNGFTLTTGRFVSSNTNTRAITFGSNNIVLALTVAASVNLDMATTTNFTCTGAGGFTAAASVTRTFSFGSTTAGGTEPNLTLTTGASIQTITSNSWFKNLDFGTTNFVLPTTSVNLNSLTLSAGGTFTGLTAIMFRQGTITPNGKTIAALTIDVTVSATPTTTLAGALTTGATSDTTLTNGTLNLNGFTLTTGRFVSSNTNTRAITFGSGNIALTHTTAAQTVLNMADATNFSYTGTGGFTAIMSVTRTFTFGTTSGSATNAPNLAITSGASVPTFTDGSWFKGLNFTGSTCTPAVSATIIGIYVDTLTLATGGTYTAVLPIFTRTQTWTSQFSKQLAGIGCNIPGGTLTLDNTQTYTATSICFLYSGTINLNNTNQTFGSFSGIGIAPRSITTGGSIAVYGNWTVSNGENFSTDSDTIIYMNNINPGTTTTFTGANGVYGILVQRSPNTLIVTGSNSFNDIQISNSMP